MLRFTAQLLGPFAASYDGQPLSHFRTKAVQALLVYLACQPEAHRRESLMALLWPDVTQASAQNSLRQTLYYVRQAVPKVTARGGGEPVPFLLADRQMVQVNPDAAYELDVAAFERRLNDPPEQLSKAVELYRGDFLDDFYLPDSAPFEAWVLARRADLRRQAMEALDTLIAGQMEEGAYETAEDFARRQLAIDNLHERAHRRLMEILVRRGLRSQALSHYETTCRLLQEELGVQPTEETEELIERVRSGDLGPSVPSGATPDPDRAASSIRKHNLRSQGTVFIGRERELRELDGLAAAPHTRLINIVGPGGIGKSRLALAFAERQLETAGQNGRPDLADGLFFIPLQPLRTLEEMIAALAQELDFPFDSSEQRSPKEQLLGFLREKHLLLILDNLEHLLDQATLLTEMLDIAPGLRLIVTSRERLNLYEEQAYPLDGLAFPDETAALEPRNLTAYTSVELFMERAHRVLPGYALPPEDAPHLAELCRLVAGMPLALELAASWIDIMSPPQILAEIQQNIDFLAVELQNVPERHRSMRAVFDSAWRRLSAAEQAILPQLCVFRGDFSAQAAAPVVGADRRTLAGLVRKSMLQVDPQSGRYLMQGLLRQYSEPYLPEQVIGVHASSPEAGAKYRHSVYYCQALTEWEKELKGERQVAAVQEMVTELDNVRAAWEWAAGSGLTELLARAAEGLAIFIDCRANHPLGEHLFGIAVRALKERLASSSTDPAPELRLAYAVLLTRYGRFLDQYKDAQRRSEVAEESLAILEQLIAEGLDTRLEQADTWELIAFNHTIAWRHEAALGAARKSLALSQAAQDDWRRARALQAMGMSAQFMDDLDQSEEWLETCLVLQRKLGNRAGEAGALGGLANVVGRQGELEKDVSLSREGLVIFESLGNELIVAKWSGDLGGTLAQLGRFEEAESLQAESLARLRRLGVDWPAIWVQSGLASSKESLGRYDEACSLAQASLKMARKQEFPLATSLCLRVLGTIAVAEKRYEEAQRFLQERQNMEGMSPLGVAYGEACQAYAALGLQDDALAADLLLSALRVCIEYRGAIHVLPALPAGALLLARRGFVDSALALYTAASGNPAVGNSRWYDDVVGAPLRELARSLPPAVVQAAEARGRGMDRWEAAQRLLEELDGQAGLREPAAPAEKNVDERSSEAELTRDRRLQ